MRSGGDSLPIGGIFLIFNVGGRAAGSYLWQGFMFMQAIVKKKKKKKKISRKKDLKEIYRKDQTFCSTDSNG